MKYRRYTPRYTPINEPLTAPGKPPIPDPKPDPFPGPPGEEPCEVYASSIRATASEMKARMLEKQLKLAKLSSMFDEQLMKAAFFSEGFKAAMIPPHMLKDVDIPPGKIERLPAEVGFGPALPQPDTAKPAKRRGKLHKGHAAFEVTLAIAACNATLRYDGRPTTHIPFRKP